MTLLASPADDENHPGTCGTALSTASYPWLLGKLEATGSYAGRGPTKMLQLYKFSREIWGFGFFLQIRNLPTFSYLFLDYFILHVVPCRITRR